MTWERGGVGLPENRSIVVKGVGLIIDTAKVQDTGTYHCKATNILGTKTKTVNLEVHSKLNRRNLVEAFAKRSLSVAFGTFHIHLRTCIYFLAFRLSCMNVFKR